MRILHIPEIDVAAPAVDNERVDSLENIAKSILKKLESLDERIESLEKARLMPVPMSAPVAPAPVVVAPVVQAPAKPAPVFKPTVQIDTEAVKKNLLAKMWKYLNDESTRAA